MLVTVPSRYGFDPLQSRILLFQSPKLLAYTDLGLQDKEKPMAVRNANIMAARGRLPSFGLWLPVLTDHKAVADAIRTSLGPRGMDKMIQTGKGQTMIVS